MKFRINRPTPIIKIIAHISDVSQDRVRESIMVKGLMDKLRKYNYIEKRKSDIPKSISYREFLAEACDMQEHNVIEQLEEIKEFIAINIKNGKDVDFIEDLGFFIDDVLKHLEIEYTQGNIQVLGEWKGFETEVITPLDEVIRLFANTTEEKKAVQISIKSQTELPSEQEETAITENKIIIKVQQAWYIGKPTAQEQIEALQGQNVPHEVIAYLVHMKNKRGFGLGAISKILEPDSRKDDSHFKRKTKELITNAQKFYEVKII